jgi:hypothetical protein
MSGGSNSLTETLMEGNTVNGIDSDGLRVIGNGDLSELQELGDNFIELVA